MKVKINKIIYHFIHKLTFSCLAIGLASASFADNIGTFGQVYGIAEEDFLNFIQHKLKTMQANGEWQKIENTFRQNVEHHADRPPVNNSLTITPENRTRDFDPSITVPYDLRDANGNIIAKAGTKINPLQYLNLHHALLFFDGDDPKQIQVAKNIEQTWKGEIKLVLVKGSVGENEKTFHKPIYFDQGGRLVTKLNIQYVPTLVWQSGLILKISEIKP